MDPILVVAATEPEIAPLIAHFGPKTPFDVLITGVGMVATAYALGNYLSVKKYRLVINLGIAGSFDRHIALGEVVEVIEDQLSELGAEEDTRFIPIDELGFGESRFYPSAQSQTQLIKVRGITVNTVHGSDGSIAHIAKALSPQLESMEGAAFFYACKMADAPCLQIRAVSNYIEKRNRDSWKIGLAVKNLNNFAMEFIGTMALAK